jgi:hypothetical protein
LIQGLQHLPDRGFQDDGLAAFNKVMAMETISLLDDEKQSMQRTDLSLYEIYNTRLVRIDRSTRDRQDPFQRRVHKLLRAFRYWKLSRRLKTDEEGRGAFHSDNSLSYQNTVFLAEIFGRFVIAVISGVFLVVPLAILSGESDKKTQLSVVSAFILVFSFLVSIMLRVSNLETLIVSAAYAAVLTVFVSNGPTVLESSS